MLLHSSLWNKMNVTEMKVVNQSRFQDVSSNSEQETVEIHNLAVEQDANKPAQETPNAHCAPIHMKVI